MSNDKVQPNPEKRISRIHKGIRRTLQTAAYESVVIEDSIEEDIEWTTLEERQRKVANWEMLAIQNFKKFHDMALTELGCEHKCAFPKDARSEKMKPKPGQKTELDDLLNDLDSLDAVDGTDDDVTGA